MKILAASALLVFLTCGTAIAAENRGEPQTAKRAGKHKTAKTPAKKSEMAELASTLAKVQESLQTQQQQIQELKEALASRDREVAEAKEAAAAATARATDASAKANEAASATTEVKTESATLTTAVSDLKASDDKLKTATADQVKLGKSFDERIKAIGPFSFSGDFRLRDEPFFGGPVNQSQVRNRERFRARLNINAKLNNEFSGGLALATGDSNDPISTNQTTNQFYTRKPFMLDRAFINYTPKGWKALTLTGGKFAYPFYRTELTWDNDLNPEGLAQTLGWDFKAPVLKRVALVGFELPFTEVAGVGIKKSVMQSAVYGGQLQTVWQLGKSLKFSGYASFYNYHNADPIALALRTASLANPQTPTNGLLPLGGTSVQNSIVTTTRATIVTANTGIANTPTALPTGVTTVSNAQFASKFGLFDAIARFDISTGNKRLPLVFLGDYVQNTRACANVGNILPTPANTATATFSTSTSAPCFSRERRGYWLEGRVGRLSDPHDLQLSYTRMMIEREAVMGAFNFSDLRQSTNVSQHRVEVIYQWYKNVQLEFTGLFGRPLNWHNGAAAPEPMLKRLQFDVIYKF
ncbi:MAG: hypothetical protein NVS9B4_24230 [Candidatus Acidiferrum sp.]